MEPHSIKLKDTINRGTSFSGLVGFCSYLAGINFNYFDEASSHANLHVELV